MRNWGGTWLDSLTRLLSVYGWGCGHLKTRMGLQGPCHGWLLSRSLRAPLRNARVSSGQGFRLQPELLIQGRSSECLKASLRSPAVTLPQCWLVRDQPRLMREGPEHGDEEPQVALEAGALVTHVRCIGPFLLFIHTNGTMLNWRLSWPCLKEPAVPEMVLSVNTCSQRTTHPGWGSSFIFNN